ncbi:MAG: hypothetical protein EPO21_16860 [Chloroflexota bacterium]|nr:MAG: hypothetical protein EPO21_16860 [Chloroflexota bacterium]
MTERELYNVSLYVPLHGLVSLLGWPGWLPYGISGAILVVVLWWCWRAPDPRDQLATSVASGPLIMPYTSSSGLALSMIVGWPRLVERQRYLAAGVIYAQQILLLHETFAR